MNINAVIFDIDNTLYPEIEYFIDVVSAYTPLSIYVNEIRALWETGFRYNSEDILRDILLYFNLDSTKNHNDLFEMYRSVHSNIILDEDTINSLEYLMKNNIKIGILTNGVREVQQNKFKCLNLENYVDGVIYAKLTGEEKPHQKPFNSICNLLGIPMRNTLMIGDDYKNDVLGALNAGMHSVFLNKYPSVKPVNSYKHSFSSIYDIVTEFIDE
jgi:putative hydrolase of the HAD superfamily